MGHKMHFNKPYDLTHGRIIKWTQHIRFLTLAGMARVVEGNHGNDTKRRIARILCLSSLAKLFGEFVVSFLHLMVLFLKVLLNQI